MGQPENSPIDENAGRTGSNASADVKDIAKPINSNDIATSQETDQTNQQLVPSHVAFGEAIISAFDGLPESDHSFELERTAHNTKILMMARTEVRSPFKDDDGFLNFKTRKIRKQPERYVPHWPTPKKRAGSKHTGTASSTTSNTTSSTTSSTTSNTTSNTQ